ncbi:DUF3987 domain-containing protein [Glaciimonas sp. PCH181]|uniref:DUF3987 domain-containing protein n=1 Tax=Glaciimonas sp. PCH181 TaxID=2133943 RepID=UPI000D379C6A|nr:DUF3987 domain-containing protein [Glaciimonas sp. PCH181]PUA19560.1 hypothetical protein C7W93_06855 [Glaciimonas sp. PCH181]
MYNYEMESATGSRFDESYLADRGPAVQAWGLPQELLQNRQADLAAILPKDVAELLDEIVADVDATQELVFSMILATSAIAVQGVFNVQHPNADMKPIPASLFVLGIAGSAQRKSTVLECLTEEFEVYQKMESKSDIRIKVQEAQYRGWSKKYEKICTQIEENFDDPEKVSELQGKLEELETTKPERGKSGINLINRDTSLPALLDGTEMQSPNTSSVLHEARDMLSQLWRWMATLSLLWDGATIKRDRPATKPVLQFDPRFSLVWIIQPKRWKEYLLNHGTDFLESGLGGRLLAVTCPDRKPTGQIRRHSIGRNARDRHNARIKTLIMMFDENLKTGKVDARAELTRSSGANELFMKVRSWIDLNLSNGGYFKDIPEFGGRCAENIMRIAGVLHVIAGCNGMEISEDIMRSVVLVMRFLADQHRTMFGDLRKPVGERYAKKVEQFLLRCFNSGTQQPIPVRTIQQGVGSQEMRKKRVYVTDALEILAKKNIVSLIFGMNGTAAVFLNHEHFSRLNRPAIFSSM